jgi:hypothetical protein
MRLRISLAALLVALLAPATLAHASAYTKVLQTYEQTGTIPACKYPSSELGSALKGVDTYGAQYFADFTNAIQAALAARAGGQCGPGGPPHPVGIAGSSPTRSPALPGPVTAATDAGLPAPIALMAALAAMFALVAVTVGLMRLRGWDPAWAAAWRHAWGEAGYRAGGIWSEFRDWLRSA